MTDDHADFLAQEHTPEAIRRRIDGATSHSYVGDFVLGAVDGTVTTFAIVSGAAGAGLSGSVVVILGLANVVADGFSMAASNFLKSRADLQNIERHRKIEERHIDEIPDGEREEIRQIFAAKGFDGPVLDQVVEVITQDRKRWVDTMLTEELGLPLESPSPTFAAVTTLLAFILAGLIPLLPLFSATQVSNQTFVASSALAAATFFVIGMIRGRLAQRGMFITGLETLALGGSAALLAFLVGAGFRDYAGA